MRRTGIIGEYRQSDGWHIAQPFESPAQAREWAARVDESEGHHYARRWRRVRINSSAYSRALHIEFHATMEAAFDADVPLVIENVRGAQRFMGRAQDHRGAFYFWGDVPPLLPRVQPRQKQSMSSTRAAERAVIPFELAYAVGTWLLPCQQRVEAA